MTGMGRKAGDLVFVICSLLPAIGMAGSERSLTWSLVLFLCLWPLAYNDWRSFRLPNLLNGTLLLAGVLYVARQQIDGAPVPWSDHVIGAAAGFLSVVLLDMAYRALRGRAGIGMGDAKMLAGIGMWLGWKALPFVLLGASVSALIFAAAFYRRIHRENGVAKLPFGAFLGLSTWGVWLCL